jgi:hypothetical protein
VISVAESRLEDLGGGGHVGGAAWIGRRRKGTRHSWTPMVRGRAAEDPASEGQGNAAQSSRYR